MEKAWIEIGSAPVLEDCACIGDRNYRDKALIECRLFQKELETAFFREFQHYPEEAGLKLRLVASDHDLGRYYEVAVGFPAEDPIAGSKAYWLLDNAPLRWSEASCEALSSRLAALAI